ncbi:MAG TPA: BtpA/SgcQ family protein [Anaerolineaceae bacterium]|nr:BtpA/SgcQ family protein [Anaerolineaceae bacterium]
MTGLTQDIFGTKKPIIAMAHIPALPGTPRFDSKLGIDGAIEKMSKDIKCLLDAGVDAVMFCNEDDRPYSFQSDFASVAAMTRIVTELKPKDRPFGVDYLWDAKAPLAVAKATGAAFIREVVTGVYESDMGLWAPDPASIYKFRSQIDAQSVKVFANITPEFASPLGTRSIAQRAKSAVVSTLVDVLLIAGPMAGSEPDLSCVQEAKEAVGGDVPVFLNTGARLENIEKFLSVADGAIVGSTFKVDGKTWNPVDPARVNAFMDKVRAFRK